MREETRRMMLNETIRAMSDKVQCKVYLRREVNGALNQLLSQIWVKYGLGSKSAVVEQAIIEYIEKEKENR